MNINGKIPHSSLELGNILSKVSGYSLKTVPVNSSYAGFKDWFILKYNKPCFTIELGLGENPLPISDFDSIYKKVYPLLVTCIDFK